MPQQPTETAAAATIRPATAADFASILELWREAENRPTVTDTEGALQGLLSRDPSALLVAADEGEIVGSLIVGWDGWRGSFYRLAVHPRHRRQGLATALVRAGERQLAALGAVRLAAIVADTEPAAVGLWEGSGYERQLDTRRFVRVLGG